MNWTRDDRAMQIYNVGPKYCCNASVVVMFTTNSFNQRFTTGTVRDSPWPTVVKSGLNTFIFYLITYLFVCITRTHVQRRKQTTVTRTDTYSVLIILWQLTDCANKWMKLFKFINEHSRRVKLYGVQSCTGRFCRKIWGGGSCKKVDDLSRRP